MKKFTKMMILALVLLFVPMQVNAAEVVQDETIPLVQDGYYQEVEKDGIFERHDAEGNLVSSTKVEDALFRVNSTLTEGWGKATIGDSHIEGTFKNATFDKKGYFRCSFTTESNVVYDNVVVKVKILEYEKWASEIHAKAVANQATETQVTFSENTGGSTGENSGESNGGNGGNGGGSTGDPNPGFGGWKPSGPATPSGDSNPGFSGW